MRENILTICLSLFILFFLISLKDVIGCSSINKNVCSNSWDCVISEREAIYESRDSCLIEIQDCGCWSFNCYALTLISPTWVGDECISSYSWCKHWVCPDASWYEGKKCIFADYCFDPNLAGTHTFYVIEGRWDPDDASGRKQCVECNGRIQHRRIADNFQKCIEANNGNDCAWGNTLSWLGCSNIPQTCEKACDPDVDDACDEKYPGNNCGNNYCSGNVWHHNFVCNSNCKCTHDQTTCNPSGCCDATCNDASGCGLNPNNNKCSSDQICNSACRCVPKCVDITITSDPIGSGFVSVDGNAITTPQTYCWTPGSTHTLSANLIVQTQPALRFIFSKWSDGGTQTHTITTPSSPTTYTANYYSQVYLLVRANSSSGGTVSGSGWYSYGASATISASANTCYLFSDWTANWGGGYSGNNNPASVNIDIKAFDFAKYGNTPTQTANFGYNNGASCGTQHCSNLATHTAGDDCTDDTCEYEHYGQCSSGSCTYLSKYCDDYDDDYLERVFCRNGDIYNEYKDYECIPIFGNRCAWTGDYIYNLKEDCSDTCSDSDGGKNYKTAGTVTDKNLCSSGQTFCPADIVKTDECVSSTKLREYYCLGNDYTYEDYECTNLGADYTCSGGRCVPQDQCNSDADCDDSNPCTTDKCNNPTASDSTCSYANVTSGTSCGTCKECDGSGNCINRPDGYNDCGSGCQRCVSGSCKDYNLACLGTISSCYCSADSCITCQGSGCCDATCSAYTCGLTPNNANCPSGQTCQADCSCSGVAGCSGNIDLTLSSTRVPPSAPVTPSASGLSNCNGKTVTFREGSCSGTIKSSCSVSGNGCTGNAFNAPPNDGLYTYYACIDKNNDNDFSDPGEQDRENLQVDSSLLADFNAWLGIDSLSATLGQTFPVSIYIKNTGSVTDSYSLSVSSSSNVQTKLWDSKISDVLPGRTVSTKVDIEPLISQPETVTITVTSDSGKSKDLKIEIKVGSSNMSDIDAFSIILMIVICCLILFEKTQF